MKHYKHKRVMTLDQYVRLWNLLYIKGVQEAPEPVIETIAKILDMDFPPSTTKVVKKCRKKA